MTKTKNQLLSIYKKANSKKYEFERYCDGHSESIVLVDYPVDTKVIQYQDREANEVEYCIDEGDGICIYKS
tara:strand:+ start:331 stop:543 length:213 start_codon:yes stop_codon:yes gene_type:complete